MRLSPLAVAFLSTKVSGFSPTVLTSYHKNQRNGSISQIQTLSSIQLDRDVFNFALHASSNDEESNGKNGISAPITPEPLPQSQEEKKTFFNDRFINDDLEALIEERAQEQIVQKDEEISDLMRQKDQRETAINRLKFQLLDFKEAVEKSEKAKAEAEKQLEKIEKETATSTSQQKNIIDELKSQFKLEKKEMSSNLQAVSKELDEVKVASKKELDKARSDAEDEKVQLMLEIASLQQALQTTTLQIDETKNELDALSTSNVTEYETMQEDLSKKDEEINSLMLEKEELQQRLDSRLIELDQLRSALNESEEQVALLEKQVVAVREESEKARKADQDLLAELKSQFTKEKASLSQQLQTFTEDVTKFKADKEDQLKKVKSDSQGEIERLSTELLSAQKELEKIQSEFDVIKDVAENAEKKANEKVRRQKEESKRFDRNVRSAAAQDKKALRREVWDLETKLEAAKYNYITVKKDLEDMQSAANAFDEKMKDLESSYTKQLVDLEAKLKAEEVAYQQSQESAKERMQRLILAFQRRLVRREDKAKKSIESVRDELTKDFELQKKELQQEKEDAVNEVISKAKMDLDEATKNFDEKIEDFKGQMEAAKKKSKKEMDDMEATYQTNLKYERVQAVKAKEAIIAEKDTAIKTIRADAATKYNILRTDLTSQLDKSLEEKTALLNTLSERDLKITAYEEERQSFRKLARLTWKVTRNKIMRRGKKQ